MSTKKVLASRLDVLKTDVPLSQINQQRNQLSGRSKPFHNIYNNSSAHDFYVNYL